jgi:hypothetical protein
VRRGRQEAASPEGDEHDHDHDHDHDHHEGHDHDHDEVVTEGEVAVDDAIGSEPEPTEVDAAENAAQDDEVEK